MPRQTSDSSTCMAAAVICSPGTHRDLAGRISKAAGVAVLVLDYRLAPEHPYPAAVHDALAALRWMDTHGPKGTAPARAPSWPVIRQAGA